MGNEISSFDEYLEKYNVKKEEPVTHIDIEYETEVDDLSKELEEIDKSIKEEKTKEYQVRVVVASLRYFSGPGINYVVFGVAKRGDEFTITEQATGAGALHWGKIKDLDGDVWIPLDYCERI